MQQIAENLIETLHVCIDPQNLYLYRLSVQRRRTFFNNLRSFADALWPIPTLCVASDFISADAKFAVYEKSLRPTERMSLIESNELSLFGVRDYEDILIKTTNNAFDRNILNDFLRRKYPNLKRLIFTGMNTRFCVLETIRSAIQHGFDCVAIFDLMADCQKDNHDSAPLWHRQTLLRAFPETGTKSKIDIVNADSFLRLEGKDPVPALTWRLGKPLEKQELG